MSSVRKIFIALLSVISLSVVAVSPAAAVVPDAPTNMTFSAIDQTSITVSWDAPAAGDPVDDYTVSSVPAGDGPFTIVGTTATFATLTPNVVHTFTVTANNADGSNLVPLVDTESTLAIAPTSAPTVFAAAPGTPAQTAVNLTWVAPSVLNGSAVASYLITASPAIATTAPGAGATAATITGLTPSTFYTFSIVAVNAAGSSVADTVTITTAAPLPVAPGPAISQGITLNGTSPDTTFLVNWGAPVTGDAATTYTVTIPGIAGSPFTVNSPTTQFTVTNASAGTSYTATIVANNATGSSSGVSASVTTASVPGAPGTPNVSIDSSTSIDVSWSAAAGNGDAVNSYTATVSPGGQSSTTGGTSTTITGLTAGQAYTVTVTATNDVGAGAASSQSSSITPIGVSSAPQSVAVSFDAQQLNTLTVNWAAPASTNGSAIQNYIVTVTKAGGSTITVSPNPGSGATSTVVTGLEAGTYTAKVVAVNAAGNSATADSAGSVEVLTAPGLVTNFTTVIVSPGNVAEISWDPPVDDGGTAINGYTISMAGATATVAASATSVRLGPLPGGSYSATIHANTSAGSGASIVSNTVEVYGFAPFFDEDAFVKQQYQDFLGRNYDDAGLAYWQGQTADDRSNVTGIITRFMDSNEFAPRRSVARLYLAYFDRDPDLEGFDFWTRQIATGKATIETVSEFFARSPEFQARYPNLTNRQFVDRVYLNVLGRAGETSGVDYWTGRLDTGLARGTLMTFFSESPENRTRTEAEVHVIVTYRGMLDRKPDAGGKAYWVGAIRNDANALANLIHGFYYSPEYAGRVTP